MRMMMNRFTRLLLSLLVFFMLAGTAGSAFAQTKIAYVDLQKALLQVEDGKKAKSRLKKEFDKKQKELDKKQANVKKMKDDLEAGAMMMTEDAKRSKAMELQKQMYELQQLYMTLQGELSKKEAEATKKIFDQMATLLAKIGKEKGYDLILEKTESSILYAKPAMDITDELIKRYNAGK